jgi:acyl-CoA synthetase (NDP forming)
LELDISKPQPDVNHADFLEYLGDDSETRVIALYIEGIQDGKKFMEVAKRVTKRKPVVALKAGRTEKGADAVASHTGSLAGDDAVYDAAFRQAGITRATDMNELNDFTKVFATLPTLPTGNRVGVVTFSGAAGGLAADACGDFGLELSKFSTATIEKIKEILPSWASFTNPLDLFPVLEVDVKESYKTALTAFSLDPNIDAVILIALTTSIMAAMNAVDVFYEYAEQGPPKPTVMCGLLDDEWLKKTTSLELKGIPTYPTIERAVKALAAAYSRHRFLAKYL